MKIPTRTLIIPVLVLSFFTNAFAQIRLSEKLKWKDGGTEVQISEHQVKTVPFFYGAQQYEEFKHLPVYATNIPLNSKSRLMFELVNPVYKQLNGAVDFDDLDVVPSDVQIQYEMGYFKKRPIATIYFVPMRKNPVSGQVEILRSFDLEVTIDPMPTQTSAKKRSRSYASNSVLDQGTWYKISVEQDGLHKIDYSFLEDLGIDPANIDPRNIRIYGNGGGMLPEQNGAFRYDDLVENPISVIGEGDGVFNKSDYILFYGQGPHRWEYDESDQRFHHEYNLYSEKTYYFLTIANQPGKRWSSLPNMSGPNATVTTYDDYQFHELEKYNLINSGRRWFGDYFNFSATSHSFSFNFPNIETSEAVYVKTSLAGRSTSQASTYSVLANNQPVYNFSVPSVPGSYTSAYAKIKTESGTFTSSNDLITIEINFSSASASAEGWLDYVELNARRKLIFGGAPMQIRDSRSVGTGARAEFVIQNANSNVRILDVTNPVNVKEQGFILSGNEIHFVTTTDSLKEFYVYAGNSVLTPEPVGQIDNQNLHATGQPDMLMIVHPSLWNEATTLANHHENKNSLDVALVNVEQIYNEFASGSPDPTAIRDFAKMVYDRAGNDTALMPKYLLLFGDATYDYKGIMTSGDNNLVPTYQSPESVEPVSTFATDDYFGLLDDSEGSLFGNNAILDIAIGRLPVSTAADAQNVINKIIHYQSTDSYGSWRNTITFVGDDEDNNLHLNQANSHANYIENNYPDYNVDKIYLDAYEEQSTPGGSRYPDVNEAINRRIFSGTLIMNYTGHGGTSGWAHERVLQFNDINSWDNFDKLALFVTATCEFSKFDDGDKVTAGEQVLLNPKGGAIAMVTTVRLVFASANATLNGQFLEEAFTPYNGRMPTIGEALMRTKNNIAKEANNRKFVLLGDPSVTLAYPRYQVVTTQINEQTTDTLKALKKMTISGEVRDDNGMRMTDFNGIVYPTIFDKPEDITTLKNDPGSYKRTFKLQKNVLYKGKASVNNGTFTYSFVVPKDISYNFGEGKISYYAEDIMNERDANGFSNAIIGGTADDFEADGEGPDIELFMNDEKFVFGGTTDENPLLLVKLSDFSGINTVGTGIGHDITAVLDDNSQNTFVLNEFYEAELDNYQKGAVQYPFSNLKEGRHSVTVKAWDVHNNSAEGYTEFIVASSAELALSHVLNYPNPFTTKTNFQFEHNKPGEILFVQVQIMTVSGKLIKTIHEQVVTDGYRVDNIPWNGLDDYGDKIGRGVYIYKLNVRASDGSSAHKMEKLVILR